MSISYRFSLLIWHKIATLWLLYMQNIRRYPTEIYLKFVTHFSDLKCRTEHPPPPPPPPHTHTHTHPLTLLSSPLLSLSPLLSSPLRTYVLDILIMMMIIIRIMNLHATLRLACTWNVARALKYFKIDTHQIDCILSLYITRVLFKTAVKWTAFCREA